MDSSALVSSAYHARQNSFSLYARPDATTPPPYPIDVDALLKDQRVYHAYSDLLFGHRGQAQRYDDMQKATVALQKQVAGALADLRS